MFFARGGQMVEKGIYWEPNTNRKIVLESDGTLPGTRKVWYYKLPECYLLIPGFALALGLSMAFPYGAGLVLFAALCVVYKVMMSLTFVAERLLKELAVTLLFGYKPNLAFFTGIKKKLRRQGGKGDGGGAARKEGTK